MVRVMGRVFPSRKPQPVAVRPDPVVTLRLADQEGFTRSPRWQRGAARLDRRARRHGKG